VIWGSLLDLDPLYLFLPFSHFKVKIIIRTSFGVKLIVKICWQTGEGEGKKKYQRYCE
jgi:hypothetical protein